MIKYKTFRIFDGVKFVETKLPKRFLRFIAGQKIVSTKIYTPWTAVVKTIVQPVAIKTINNDDVSDF